MAFEMKDLAGLSQPMTKLVEFVSAGIGTLYRPIAIRGEAEARAFEIKAIAKAEAEAKAESKAIEVNASLNRIQTIAQSNPELAERARQRLLAREIEGQQNIEAIAEYASAALPNSVSSEPVGQDWRRKFFVDAENVCEQDMQLLWGKVLAGELASPGTFGLRTLDTLKQLSRREAELFRKACGLAMADGWIALPSSDINTALAAFGLTFGDILTLRDAGLILHGDHLHKNFTPPQPVTEPEKIKAVLSNNGVLIELSGAALAQLQLPALIFTQAGREMQRLIDPEENTEYLKAVAASLRPRLINVKRGTPIPQSDGVSLITFDQDL